MPTDRQRRIEALMQSDADEMRAQGYETEAQDQEQRLARYRAGNQQQGTGQQQDGQ